MSLTRLSIAQLLQQGKAHHQQGQWALAAARYEEVVERQPRSFEALHLLGLLALQRGDPTNALPWLHRAAKINPADAATQSLLGIALQSSNQNDAAITHFERAVRLQPDNADFHYNLGKAFRSNDRPEDARTSYETALRLKPDYPEALNNLAETLISLGSPEKALKATDDALRLKPDHAEAWSNRGAALMALRQLPAALDALDHALHLRPTLKKPLGHRAAILMDLNRFDEARAEFERALTQTPDDLMLQWNLATLNLLTGNFAAGWSRYGARWVKKLKGLHPNFRQPEWDGQPTEQRVLVWGEQGLGDQILFTSMFSEISARAKNVRFAVAPRLLTLYRRSFNGLQFCKPEEAADDQAFDAFICMGDIGRYFRQKTEDFLVHRSAYLHADASRTRELRDEITKKTNRKPVCGLSWNSNNPGVGQEKSISLETLSRLLSGLNFSYINLQYGDTESERAEVLEQGGIKVDHISSVDILNDIDGLASLVDACDVIVTISNTTAHLAGALGKTVFLMLPHAIGRFWCWQTDRSEALWYPNVRIFRQPKEGDWASVLAEVRDALAALPPPAVE